MGSAEVGSKVLTNLWYADDLVLIVGSMKIKFTDQLLESKMPVSDLDSHGLLNLN